MGDPTIDMNATANRLIAFVRERLSSLQSMLVCAAATLLVLLGIGMWVILRFEYDAHVRVILDNGERTAQKLATRTAEMFDRVNSTTRLVKHLKESGSTATLVSLHSGGVLSNDITRSVSVADARGFVVERIVDIGPLNISDEADFKRHRSRRDLQVVIGVPVRNPVSGEWSIPISRRIDGPEGRFDGVVVAELDPATLSSGIGGDDAPETAISVVGNDGICRARMVNGQVSFGERFDLVNMVNRGLQMRTTLEPAPSPVDGRERFVSSAPVDRYPFMTIVASDARVELAPYARFRARVLSVGALLAVLLLGGLAALLFQARRLDDSRRRTRRAEAQFRATLEGSMDAVVFLDAVRGPEGALQDLRITEANGLAAELMHTTRSGLLGKLLSELMPHVRTDGSLALVQRAIRTRRKCDGESLVADGPLSGRWIHQQLVPLRNGVAIIARDITQRKTAERELEELARTDGLTQLANRRQFDDVLAKANARAERQRTTLALAFLDLDGFKSINDSLGHAAGDALLVSVATRLVDCVRSTDTVCRLGGDEFAVVLEDANSVQDVTDLCQRIVDRLALPHTIDGRVVESTASVGVAMHRPGASAQSMKLRADDALYAAKRAGKARFVIGDLADEADAAAA